MSISTDGSINFVENSERKVGKQKKAGILGELEKIEITEDVKLEANRIYMANDNMVIRKGNKLTYILFVCIYNAYKNLAKPDTPKRVAALVGLKSNEISKASSTYTIKEIKFVTFPELIPRYCQEIGLKPDITDEIKKFGEELLINNEILNESFPQNIAAATIHLYLTIHGCQYEIKTFAAKVELSGVTLTNALNTVKELYGNGNVISK